jgi:hypothetical protein
MECCSEQSVEFEQFRFYRLLRETYKKWISIKSLEKLIDSIFRADEDGENRLLI